MVSESSEDNLAKVGWLDSKRYVLQTAQQPLHHGQSDAPFVL